MKTNPSSESSPVVHKVGGHPPTVSRIPPRAAVRAMQVIEALADSAETMSLASLSIKLHMPKSSLMHLLRALEAGAYIQRTATGFQLGAQSYRLASKIGATDSVENAQQQILQDMLNATQESILLGTFTDDRLSARYVVSCPSPQSVRFAPEVGTQRPLYATAVGKVLLAYSPEEFREDYLRRLKLERFTTKTVSTKSALRTQVQRIRQDGMVVSIDEMADGGSALAAPVFGRDGSVECVVVIAVPTARMHVNRKKFEAVLKEGASRMSILRGHV